MHKAAVSRKPAVIASRQEESGRSGPSGPVAAAPPVHWRRPDPVGDILAVAWRSGAAEPREIRVRPEIHERMLAELDPATRAVVEERGVIGAPTPIPLVVEAGLPTFPGFEVVRAQPHPAAA
jgi:hypothetical protein